MNELTEKIRELAAKKDACILAHSYQRPEVQILADYLGDSLDLSRRAEKIQNSVIVFCGVLFMAETAALISPEKKVLLPVLDAGCPMADMAGTEDIKKFRKENPDGAVICYVNSTAAVKAESDICCTSANAVKILQHYAGRTVYFLPDQNLGGHSAAVLDFKNIQLHNGFCIVHKIIRPEHIQTAQSANPGSLVVVHPECAEDVRALADEICSTTKMMHIAADIDPAVPLIVGTEIGIVHRMQREFPHKQFIPAFSDAVCRNMKKTSPEDVLASLENMQHVITVDKEIAEKARAAIEKMLELS